MAITLKNKDVIRVLRDHAKKSWEELERIIKKFPTANHELFVMLPQPEDIIDVVQLFDMVKQLHKNLDDEYQQAAAEKESQSSQELNIGGLPHYSGDSHKGKKNRRTRAYLCEQLPIISHPIALPPPKKKDAGLMIIRKEAK